MSHAHQHHSGAVSIQQGVCSGREVAGRRVRYCPSQDSRTASTAEEPQVPEAQLTSYDEVPYDSHAFAQTHPDTLATVATLFGMDPPPVSSCRVLELGCSSGFNIIPMAVALPEARFVGIDQSSRQISEGQKAVEALGLTNIELRQMDILQVGEDLGQFDYILCHGVYSWVPAKVQEQILEICRRNLVPNGVAYVSYNCYPGWHLAGMIRDMMIYHTRRFTEPAKRVQQARAVLDFMAGAPSDQNSVYARLLKEEADLLRPHADYYLFHDHLEKVNQPVYFHEFAERAAAHGLQYLWEAYHGDRAGYLRQEVKSTLDRLSTDLIQREQYLDFLINRRFRMSLLCHEDVTLNRSIDVERLAKFRFLSVAKPESARVDLGSPNNEYFRSRSGETIGVNQPVPKAALLCLYEAVPRALSIDELCAAVRKRLEEVKFSEPIADESLRQGILGVLRHCVWPRLVELTVHPRQFEITPGDRPVASPVARLQAQTASKVTNLRHLSVSLSPNERNILLLLDGKRDRAEILDSLVGMAVSGRITIEVQGQTVRDSARLRQILGAQLDTSIRLLAQHALLVA
jgi:methyltransferase-like protein/2-polyprenyl-3-methyl-5-hydroxy-6-metoxy-1,4-benzoquinol methylase